MTASTVSVVKQFPLFYIEAVEWTSDGRYLMAAGRDGRGRMRVYRTDDWQLIGDPDVQTDRNSIEYIDVHGNQVAIAGEDAHIRLYEVKPQ